jgi:hypothetical protein
MRDPRIILEEELIAVGILSNQASAIALDAGSPQVIVNKEYLDELVFDKVINQKALILVTKFYMGELSEE